MLLMAIGLMGAGLAGIWVAMDDVNPLLFFGGASVLGGGVLALSLAGRPARREPVGGKRPGPERECRFHLRDVIHAHVNGASRARLGVDPRIVLADHLMTFALQWQHGHEASEMSIYRTNFDEAVMIGRGISGDFGEQVEACMRQQDLVAADGLAALLMCDFLEGSDMLCPKAANSCQELRMPSASWDRPAL